MNRLAPLVSAVLWMMVPGIGRAQEVSDASGDRGPRFFLASASGRVPLDTRRTPVLGRRLVLDLEGVTRKEALAEIGRQAGLKLVYGDNALDLDDPSVRLKADGITVAAALTDILLDTGMDVVFSSNRQVVLVRRPKQAPPPEAGSVSGRVTDGKTGQGLAGVDVYLEGTKWRTSSANDGRYRLVDVGAGKYTLTVRRIGYVRRSQPITVESASDLSVDLALEAAVLSLDEVVVTGTPDATEKRALGNSIAKIKTGDVLELAPASDAIQLMNGRAPGVVIQPSTGAVGSGAAIRIRSISSFTLGGDPLLYVDGVRADKRSTTGPGSQAVGGTSGVRSRLSDFNPDDIESIEVLKGPAAAALYGTEANAGVIQIITKRGRAGARPQLEATLRGGANWFQDPERRWPTLYGRDQATGAIVEANLVRSERERGTPMFRTGQQQGATLSVSGGTDKLRYYVGGDLDNETGIEPTNKFRRLSGRSNLDLALGERVDLGVSLGLVTNDLHAPAEAFLGGVWASEDMGNPLGLATPLRGFYLAPPEAWYRAVENRGETTRLTGGIRLQHRAASWLNQRLTLGIDFVDDDAYSLVRNTASDAFLNQFALSIGGGGRLGTKWVRRDRSANHTVDYGLTASLRPTANLVSSTSLGFQYYRNHRSLVTAEGRGFPDFAIISHSAATTTFSSGDLIDNATVGGYVQQQLGWRNRLFLTGALRIDDNSAFGDTFNAVAYPKLSASWVVSEEPFWPIGFVTALKLRAAWGQSGQQPDVFSTLRTYTSVSGETGVGLRPGASGNPNLGPERGDEIEVGFEAGLWDGRVGLDFTYYNKKTKDAILPVPTIPSQGFMGSQLVNAGLLRNRGIEAMARVRVLDGRSLGWEVVGTVSHNDNRILELADGVEELNYVDQRAKHRVGYPAFGAFARRIVSTELAPDGTARNTLCAGGEDPGSQAVPCASAPYLFVGPSRPKYEGSVSSTLTLFGRLRLYAMVDFKGGHALFDNAELIRCVRRVCRELFFPNEYDPIHIAAVQNATGGFDWTIKPLRFAKLREVSASMTMPTSWATALGGSRVDLRLAARNLHTWTNWTGMDPESYQVSNAFTLIRATTPQLAQFVVTAHLVF